ncbi:hypothetical protein [Pedobacter sp.]|uniref:hypothetical protein n=1 Tax=Pedobacter sp. TaxID=1411316 RepID=UPI0035C08296
MGLKPSTSLSDLRRDIKNNSSKFVNDKNWGKRQISMARRIWCFFLYTFPSKSSL